MTTIKNIIIILFLLCITWAPTENINVDLENSAAPANLEEFKTDLTVNYSAMISYDGKIVDGTGTKNDLIDGDTVCAGTAGILPKIKTEWAKNSFYAYLPFQVSSEWQEKPANQITKGTIVWLENSQKTKLKDAAVFDHLGSDETQPNPIALYNFVSGLLTYDEPVKSKHYAEDPLTSIKGKGGIYCDGDVKLTVKKSGTTLYDETVPLNEMNTINPVIDFDTAGKYTVTTTYKDFECFGAAKAIAYGGADIDNVAVYDKGNGNVIKDLEVKKTITVVKDMTELEATAVIPSTTLEMVPNGETSFGIAVKNTGDVPVRFFAVTASNGFTVTALDGLPYGLNDDIPENQETIILVKIKAPASIPETGTITKITISYLSTEATCNADANDDVKLDMILTIEKGDTGPECSCTLAPSSTEVYQDDEVTFDVTCKDKEGDSYNCKDTVWGKNGIMGDWTKEQDKTATLQVTSSPGAKGTVTAAPWIQKSNGEKKECSTCKADVTVITEPPPNDTNETEDPDTKCACTLVPNSAEIVQYDTQSFSIKCIDKNGVLHPCKDVQWKVKDISVTWPNKNNEGATIRMLSLPPTEGFVLAQSSIELNGKNEVCKRCDAVVSVIFPPGGIADSCAVVPSTAHLNPGQSKKFIVRCENSQGNPVTPTSMVWDTSKLPAALGTFDNGLFTAQSVGTGILDAVVTNADGSKPHVKEATILVDLVPVDDKNKTDDDDNGDDGKDGTGIAVSCDVVPLLVYLHPGEQQQFELLCYDTDGDEVNPASMKWLTNGIPPGGSVGIFDETDGVFTATGIGKATIGADVTNGDGTKAQVNSANVIVNPFSCQEIV